MPLRWEQTWEEEPSDWLGYSGHHKFARVCKAREAGGQWAWYLNGVTPSEHAGVEKRGFASCPEGAMEAAEISFHDWIRNAGLRQAANVVPDE